MDVPSEKPSKNIPVTSLLVIAAFAVAAILFPTISDKLFSYSQVERKLEKPHNPGSKITGAKKKHTGKILWKEKLYKKNKKTGKKNKSEETVEIKEEDF